MLSAVASAADWSNTIAAVTHNGALYSIEKSGVLYRTDLSNGQYVQVGKSEFANTAKMFSGPKNLFTIETDGTLYRIEPSSGAWTRVGKAGDYKGTLAGVFSGTRLFTVSSGALYGTNPISGAWAQVGKAEFGGTRWLFDGGNKLFSIESDGTMYRIDLSGSWIRTGKAGDWKNTKAGASMDGIVYTVETGGALYATNPETGTWKQLGKAEFANTMFLFAEGGWLYTMEKAGLYKISTTDGSWSQIDK